MFNDKEIIITDDEEMIITMVYSLSNTVIEKRLDCGLTWKDVLNEFIDMLNGVGYVIDKAKAEHYINSMFEYQTGDSK